MATAKSGKVIISCAITGSIHTPTMSDALPITSDEIAAQAIEAAEAGAAIHPPQYVSRYQAYPQNAW